MPLSLGQFADAVVKARPREVLEGVFLFEVMALDDLPAALQLPAQFGQRLAFQRGTSPVQRQTVL